MSHTSVRRNHSRVMQEFFPKIESTGVDLGGNIEIKEITGKYRRFELTPKDFKAEFLLIFHHAEGHWWLVESTALPKMSYNKKVRSVRVSQIEPIALWDTEDIIEVIKRLHGIIDRPSDLPLTWEECQDTTVTAPYL